MSESAEAGVSQNGALQENALISPDLVRHKRRALGLVTLEELKQYNRAKPQAHVIEGLIAQESVNIGAGDSGEGKSPLAYQMLICCCCELPFLGRRVQPGPVIYVDLENGTNEIELLTDRLAKHLGAAEAKHNFYTVTDREHLGKLEQMIVEVKPVLVIIDSLRAFRPEAESKPEKAAELMNDLRRIAKKDKTAFLIIHHLKKPQEQAVPSLQTTPVMQWLNHACGAKALINQSDTRLAFAKAETKFLGKKGEEQREIALVIRGFTRLHGEFGPIYLERCHDEDGEPIGYSVMSGPALLFNTEMEDVWHKLPSEFTRKQARALYGKGESSTALFLKKCMDIGIMEQPVKGGPYRKVVEK